MFKFVICLFRSVKSKSTFDELYNKGFIRKKYNFRDVFKKECELYDNSRKKTK